MTLKEFLGNNPDRRVLYHPTSIANTAPKPVTVQYLWDNLLDRQMDSTVNVVEGQQPVAYMTSPLPPSLTYKVTILDV